MAYINKEVSTMAMPSGMNRMGQFPLDMSSVYYDLDSLKAYAQSGAIAYVGQIVSLVDETNGKVTVYSIQNLAGDLKEVGTIPLGDNKTIEVSAEGAISLLGAAGAANGTLPMIDSTTGKLVWKTLEDIGAGDGNDNTTYEFSFADQKITITPKFNGQPIIEDEKEVVYTLDLSTFVTADELNAALEALPEDQDTTYSVAEGEKVLKLANTVFSTEISLKHENGRISLTGIDGVEIAGFSDADFVKDSVLEDVSYDATTRKITFTWKTIDGVTKTDEIDVSDLVDTYTAGNGLALDNNVFSVKLASDNEAFLSADANGLKLSGVQTAIDTAKNAVIEVTDALDERIDTLEAIDHTVYATKEALKATDDKTVSNATAITNLTGRIDDIVAEGGEPNQINNIKVNGVVQAIAEDKSVDLAIPTKFSDLTDDSGFGALITAAQAQADKGVADAATAKSAADGAQAKADEAFEDAAAAQSTADSALAKAGANETAITALQNADTTLGGKITALETTVNNETSGVAANYAAITNINSTLGTLTAKDTAHDEKLAALETATGNNATAITNLQSAVSNVYTKTESDNKYATIANVGTPAEGKTIVQMIADAQAAATYDDTKVKEDIQKNATAIENITKEGGVIAVAVKAEADRAAEAEQALADDIAEINALLNTVSSEDNITSLKELAIWVEEHGGEASKMAEAIEANADAIELINDAERGILVQAKAHSDANLATAKAYTDAEIAKIHGVDDKTIKLAENKAYVAEVSTDVLVQGAQELVLCGGNASGFTIA